MVFDPQAAKVENDRINNLLMKEPEYESIKKNLELIRRNNEAIGSYGLAIQVLQEKQSEIKEWTEVYKIEIREYLESLESKTGFSKAPGLAHLMMVPAKFEVKDPDAVPAEFVKTKMTSSVDKVKLNKAIATGQLDTNVNWLETVPAYKTVVIE